MQYDLEGNFIKEWVTTMEIQRQLNYHRSNISNCCNGLVKPHIIIFGGIKMNELNDKSPMPQGKFKGATDGKRTVLAFALVGRKTVL